MNSTPTKKSKHNHVSNPGHLDQQIDLNTVPFKLKAPKQPVSETLKDSYTHCHVCFQSHLYHSVHASKEAKEGEEVEGLRKRPFEDKGFDMLTCYGCELTVHRYCYGLRTPINQVDSNGEIVNMFICDRCSSVGPNELKECAVCQQKNGALKKIGKRDAYVHVTCALFSELYYIDDFEKMTVRGCNNSDKRSKSQHVCDYCKKQGNLHTCHASNCQTVSHVYCALKAVVDAKPKANKQTPPVWAFRLGNTENPVKTLLDYEDPQIKEIIKEIFVRLRRKDQMPVTVTTTMVEETENENKNSSAKKKKRGKAVVEEEVVAPEHMLSEEEEATVIGISEEVKEKLKSIASGYGQGKTVRGGSVEMQCRQHPMEDLYCICNKPNATDISMFACDSCDNWFHHQCFGLSKDQRGKIDELSYTCKKCRLFGLFVNNFFAFESLNPEERKQYEEIKPEYETVGNLEIIPKDVSKFSISDFIIVCIIIQIQLNKQFYNIPDYNVEDDTLPKILLDNAKYIPFNLNGIMSQLLKKPLLAKGTDKIINETVPLDDYGVIESVYNPETGNFKADKLEKLEESLQILSSIKMIYEEQGYPKTATLNDVEYRLQKGQWILEVYKALEGNIQELDKVPRGIIQNLIQKAGEIKIDKNQTERKLLESLVGGVIEEEEEEGGKSGVIEEEEGTHDIVEERLQLIKEKMKKLEAIEVQKVSLEEILKALDEIEWICKEALEVKLNIKELEKVNSSEVKAAKKTEDKIKGGENIQKKIEDSCESIVKIPEVFEIIREYKTLKGLELRVQYYLKNAVNPDIAAAHGKKKKGNTRKGKKEEEAVEETTGELELSEDGGEIANIEEIEELVKECEGVEELKEKGSIKEMMEDIEKIKKEIGECLIKEALDIEKAEKLYKETKRYKVQFQEKTQLKRKLREYFKRVEDIKTKEYNYDELVNVKAEFEKKFTKENKFKEEFKNRVDKAKKAHKDAEKFLNKKQFNKDDIEKKAVELLNEMNEIKVKMPSNMKEDLEGLQKSVEWLEKLSKFRNKCQEKNQDMEEEQQQEGVDVLVEECSEVKEGEWSELYKKNYEEFKQIMKEGEDIKHRDQRIEKVLKEHASLYCDIEAGIVAEKSGHTSVEDVNKVCEIGQHFHVEKTEGVFDRVTEAQRKYTEWIQAVEEVVGSELIQDVLEEGCNGKEGEVDQLTEKADNLVKGSGHLGVDAEEDNRILKCVWRRLEWSKKGRNLLRMIREGEHVSLEAVEDFIALGQETKVPYNSWLFKEIDKELDNLTTMKEQFEEMKKVRKNMKKRIKGVGKEWDQKRKKKELDRMVKKKLKVSKVKALYEKLKKSSLFLEKVELEEMEAEIKRCEDWSEKVRNYMEKYGGKEIEEVTDENWKDIRVNVSTENAKEIIKEQSDLKNEARDLVLRDESIEGELARFDWIFRATIFTEKAIEKKSGARSWMKLQKLAESEKRETKKLSETNLHTEIQKELEKYQEFIKKMEELKAKENALMRKVWNMNDADLWTVERETIKKEDLEQLLKDLASEYRIDVKQESAYIEALLAAGKENIGICSQIEAGAYGEKVPADIVKGILGRFKASFVEFKEEEEALLEKIKKADEMRGVLNQFIGGQESAEGVIEKYKECPIYFAEAEKIGEEYKKACDTIEKVENLSKKEEKDIKLEEVQGVSKRVSRITMNLGEKLDEARKKIWKLKIQAVKRISEQEENNSETTQLQIEELKKYLVEGLKLVKHPEDQGDLRDEIQWTEDTIKDVENKLQELKEVNDEEKLQEVNKVINGFVNITREIDEQKRVLEKRRLEKEREEEAKKQEELLRKRAFDELIEKATAAANAAEQQEENGGEQPAPVPQEEEGEEEITKKLKTETGAYTQQAREKVQKKKRDDEIVRSDLRAELAEALKISKAFKSVKDRYGRIAKRIELFIYLGEGARINCHCASIDKICAAIEDLQEDSETAQRIIDGDYDFEYLKKLTLVPAVAVEPVPVTNVVDEESPIEEIQPPQQKVVENIEEEDDDEIEEIEEEEDEEDDEEEEDEEEEEDYDEDEEEIIESGGEETTRIEQEQVPPVDLPIYEKGSVLKIFEGKIMNTTSLNRSTSLSLGSSSGLKLCSMYTCEDCKTVRTFPKISPELNVAGRGALRDTLEYIEMLGRSYMNNGGANQGNNKPFLVGWIECKREVQPDMNKLGEELLEKQRVLIIKYMEYADMYILHPSMVKKELASLLDWFPRVPLGQRKPKGVLLFYIHLRIGRTFRGHFDKIEPINMGLPDPDQSKKEAEEKKALEVVDIDEGSEPVSPLTSLADGEIDERENMQRMQMNMMNMMGMNVQGGMMNMQQLMAGGMFGAPAGPGGNMGFNPELMNMWNQNMMQQQQTQMITSSFGGQGRVPPKGKGGANMVIDDDEDVIVDEDEEDEEEEIEEEDEEEIEDDEEEEDDGEIIEEVEEKKKSSDKTKQPKAQQQNIEEIEDLEEEEENEEDIELEDFEEEEEDDEDEDEEEEKSNKKGAATTTIEEDDDIIEMNPVQSKRPPAAGNRQQQQAFGMMSQGQQDLMAMLNSGMDIQSQYNAMFAQMPEQMKMIYIQQMQQMNNSGGQARKTSKGVIEEINLEEDDDEPVVEQKGNNDNKEEGQE